MAVALRKRVDDGKHEVNHHDHNELLEERGQQTPAFGRFFAALAVQLGFLSFEQLFYGFLKMMTDYRYL